jgi:predicted MFS family arabinose efflux permease
MMASILAISLAIGRIAAGVIVKHVSWVWVVTVCIVCAIAMVIVVLPKTVNAEVGVINTLSDIPLIGYAFPIVGLFIAPIYPLLNSTVLSAIPKRLHSPMTGLIVIFSAGGTLGSRIIGYLFKNVGADTAFTYTIIPLVSLLIAVFLLNKLAKSTQIS